MQQVEAKATIPARGKVVLTLVPKHSPYFDAKKIHFSSTDSTGESLDFEIQRISISRSSYLLPNENGDRFHPGEVYDVDEWQLFSILGLEHLLQIAIHNPHDVDLSICARVEGDEIHELAC